ncbi:MAG: Gfo/Idh/MocA family oxidoreductase [Victivallaceae bacterium]|nr:Gfo/Idh/MocA family oxidoreductase [Victivallaceae bacterium]
MLKKRITIVGANDMTTIEHLPVLASFNDVEIIGICDIIEERARKLAEQYGIKNHYINHVTMLDELKPDAVWLIVPTPVIFDMVMDALERKIDVFLEKPAGMTTYQTKVMAAFAERQQAISAVAFQRRYHSSILNLRKKVAEIGNLNQVSVNFYKNRKAPNGYPPNFRGAIEMLRCEAIHALDLMRFLCGLAETRNVKAVIKNFDCDYDTAYFISAEFENGMVGTCNINWRTARRLFNVELHAPGASAFIDIDKGGELWVAGNDKPVLVSQLKHGSPNGGGNAFEQGIFAENRAFVDALSSRKQVHNNLKDAVRTMELVDNVYFSNGVKPADCLRFPQKTYDIPDF